MQEFGARLPQARRRIAADLRGRGLPRERVLAAVTGLLDLTLMRVGNEEYARDNGSYGLTTLHGRHAEVTGSRIRLRFRGKSGKQHEVDLRDPRLARIVRRCQELPGQRLFQYEDDDGGVDDISSEDVNGYIREITAGDFTAKDFRTWTGTVLLACALGSARPARTARQASRVVSEAIREVAGVLANTPAVCRASYVHPAVIDAYLDGGLPEELRSPGPVAAERPRYLRQAERHVLKLLARLDGPPAARAA
jgi:DNA topoisomerase-1